MAAYKKYKHDNKEGFDHPFVCLKCGRTSLMDNGQYAGLETSICPHCHHKFRRARGKSTALESS